MNTTMMVLATPTASDSNTNIKAIKLKITMCPAVIATNKRTIKANGLVNRPMISTGTMINNNGTGTPGVANTCFQ